jgi:5-methylcytosine-specific restriction endonuclease McrA
MPDKPTIYRPPTRARQSHNWNKNADSPKRVTGRALQARNKRIKVRDRFTCQNKQCGLLTTDVQIDHKIALTQGGEDTDDNLQCLCPQCHAIKSKIEAVHKRLPDPTDYPLTYKAALLSLKSSNDSEGDEWDVQAMMRCGGTPLQTDGQP